MRVEIHLVLHRQTPLRLFYLRSIISFLLQSITICLVEANIIKATSLVYLFDQVICKLGLTKQVTLRKHNLKRSINVTRRRNESDKETSLPKKV